MNRSGLWLSLLAYGSFLGLGAPQAAYADAAGFQVLSGGCNTAAKRAGTVEPGTQTTGGLACTSTTATLSGFAPASTGTPISVTTGGVTGTLPAGTVVVATNVGTTNGAYCKLGASATTSDQYIAPNGGWFAFTVGAATQLTCITGASTTTVNMVGGSGLPTGTGGGGGGSGGAVTLASGAVSSGAYSSGSIASGAYASGSIASGALASGAISNGADVVEGTQTDTTCGATHTVSGCIYAAANNTGTTNLVTNNAATGLIQATASVAISFTAAGGPTQIIAASGSTKIYVTHIHYVLSGAGTFALITGTGTNCGTNTVYLEGASSHPLSFAANGGLSAGSGLGPIYVTGAGGEICAITTGAVDTSGVISYAQF